MLLRKKIFLLIIIFISIFITTTEKTYAIEKLKQGSWTVVETKLYQNKCDANAHLLPDGNVLIMGGCDLRFHESDNYAEIYNPVEDKIVNMIKIHEDPFLALSHYNSVSLQNGNVYITYGTINHPGDKYIPHAKIFDCNTYTFKNIKPGEGNPWYYYLFPLNNNNILILSNGGINKSKDYIYNSANDKYSYIDFGEKYNLSDARYFKKDNGNLIIFRNDKKYLYNNHKIQLYPVDIPLEALYIQLDSEKYLSIKPEDKYSIGYIYDINTNTKMPVKNKINKTFGPSALFPQAVLLPNKDVLIFGINSSHLNRYGRKKSKKKYTSYMYSYKDNKFFKINNPPLIISKDTGIVTLKNGDVLFVGGMYGEDGNKIQIYKH